MMLPKKISMAFLLVAAALAPPTRSCHLTGDEDNPLSSYFLDDTLSSMRCLQYQKRFGRREVCKCYLPRVLLMKILTQLQGDKINYNARPSNLEPALERRDNPVHIIKLTYHPGKEFGDKNTYTGVVTIGTAVFKLEFSTGSSDLWVTMGKPILRECAGKTSYTLTRDAEMPLRQAENALKKGSFYPQHGVDGLFEGFSRLRFSRETARRADNVKIGSITVKKYTFGVLLSSHATSYFCRLPFDGQVLSILTDLDGNIYVEF